MSAEITKQQTSSPRLASNTVARLAEALKQGIFDGEYPAYASLPTYRELSREHNVSQGTVRAALDILEREGLVVRPGGTRSTAIVRGGIAPVGDGSSSGIQCVNIVCARANPQASGLIFVQNEDLAGYTEAMEHRRVNLRFPLFDGKESCAQIMAPGYAFQEQGCVLTSGHASFANWLHERHIPFVIQRYTDNTQKNLPPCHSVCVNQMGGAFDATQHLIDLGHSRIGYIGVLPGSEDPTDAFDGYAVAMRRAGLTVRQEYLLGLHTNEPEIALGEALKYLGRPDRPTAVFTRTDGMAIGVLMAAKRMGIRVPDELSVVGYNNQPGAAEADPPLTTVATPRRRVARTAIEVLFKAAENQYETFVTKSLKCRLVVRKSTAPWAR